MGLTTEEMNELLPLIRKGLSKRDVEIYKLRLRLVSKHVSITMIGTCLKQLYDRQDQLYDLLDRIVTVLEIQGRGK